MKSSLVAIAALLLFSFSTRAQINIQKSSEVQVELVKR